MLELCYAWYVCLPLPLAENRPFFVDAFHLGIPPAHTIDDGCKHPPSGSSYLSRATLSVLYQVFVMPLPLAENLRGFLCLPPTPSAGVATLSHALELYILCVLRLPLPEDGAEKKREQFYGHPAGDCLDDFGELAHPPLRRVLRGSSPQLARDPPQVTRKAASVEVHR